MFRVFCGTVYKRMKRVLRDISDGLGVRALSSDNKFDYGELVTSPISIPCGPQLRDLDCSVDW